MPLDSGRNISSCCALGPRPADRNEPVSPPRPGPPDLLAAVTCLRTPRTRGLNLAPQQRPQEAGPSGCQVLRVEPLANSREPLAPPATRGHGGKSSLAPAATWPRASSLQHGEEPVSVAYKCPVRDVFLRQPGRPRPFEPVPSALSASYWSISPKSPPPTPAVRWPPLQKRSLLQFRRPESDPGFAGLRPWAPSRPCGRVGSWSLAVSGGCWGSWPVAAPLRSLLLSSHPGPLGSPPPPSLLRTCRDHPVSLTQEAGL